MTPHTMLPENPLSLYGAALETYRGTGQLTLSSKRQVTCEFVAGQLEMGKTVLLCATQDWLLEHHLGLATADLFEGTTEDGHQLKVDHVVSETNYLPESLASGTYIALRVGHLTVIRRPSFSRRQLTFLLTNLSGIHADVTFTYHGLTFVVRPLANSSQNLERLQVLRGVLPTSQLEVATQASTQRVIDAADDICYLLSIALGSKIQWIALTESPASGSWAVRHHYSRVTKRYGALYVVDPNKADVATFLQFCSADRLTLARERIGLTNPVIDTYLDAKAEGDFLQVRALKLVVAVEMFKAAFSEVAGIASLIFSAETFRVLRSAIKAAAKNALPDASRGQLDKICNNIGGLNRTSFSSQLRRLCEAVAMPMGANEINRFVASRNKLVHEGHFYCERATDQEKTQLAPLASPKAEWFWLLHFVDRLFLRAIDYQGTYIDWSIPSKPEPRQLLPAA